MARADFVFETKDRDEALKLRTMLINKVPRLWVLVHKLPDEGVWGIEVNNVWGGAVSKDKKEQVENLILEATVKQ